MVARYADARRSFLNPRANGNWNTQINWDRRFEDWNCLHPSCTVDGIDFKISQVRGRRRVAPTGRGGPTGVGAFFSHKIKHDALRYYICVHVHKALIVAAGGGYPAGAYNDRDVFVMDFSPILLLNESLLADGGYQAQSGQCMVPLRRNAVALRLIRPDVLDAYSEAYRFAKGRHEHLNAEVCEWSVMKQSFRHHPALHFVCFMAVIQLTQLRMALCPSILPPPQQLPVIDDNGGFAVLYFE